MSDVEEQMMVDLTGKFLWVIFVQELFDFIAKRLVDFVNCEGEGYRPKGRQQIIHELGLTFLFPVKQTSVNSSILIQWSKGFKIADGVGADVVALLQSAINRQHGPKIEVAVLVPTLAMWSEICPAMPLPERAKWLSIWSGADSGCPICPAHMQMSSLIIRASILARRVMRK